MRLFIAEKPSLARAIVQVLPLPHRRYRDHFECGEGNVVAWCAGHILEPVMPEQYDRKYARWALEDLAIVPRQWKLRASIPGLVSVLKGLLRGAKRVVHAGDPDREGQLLVDEVLDFLGYAGPVDRILIRDTNPEAVARQLAALEPNAKYRPLGTAALARQRADWLYGINMTRLYTLLGQAAGYERRVLSVGRVQTPVLGLVVARDAAIEGFQPAPYFVVSAKGRTAGGETLPVRWAPERLQPPEVDGEGRILQEQTALGAVERLVGAQARVTRVVREEKAEPVPLPYSLADLQIDAARSAGLSAQQVLDACQALYETHCATTYPRSDCSYLPEGHRAEAVDVLAAIAIMAPDLSDLTREVELSLRSRAWNDRKVTAHHAIIPTRTTGRGGLSPTERVVYGLIARRYVSQFLAPHGYALTRVELGVDGQRVFAAGRETLCEGWRKASPTGEGEGSPQGDRRLPALREGETVTLTEALASRKETQAPSTFTDATLMQAMVNVAGHVSDPRIKALLTEADGIGTPATRAGIVETLFERGYIERRGRAIVSTAVGRALIASLPAAATTPDMTAAWEATMSGIADGSGTMESSLEQTAAQLAVLVGEAKARGVVPAPPAPVARPTARAGAPRARTSQRGRSSRG